MTTDLTAVKRPIAQANGLPNAHYTDAQTFAEERNAVLYASWTGLAVAADVPENGDAKPLEFLGLPLLLIRDKDGVVRVFRARSMGRSVARIIRGAIRPKASWLPRLMSAAPARTAMPRWTATRWG